MKKRNLNKINYLQVLKTGNKISIKKSHEGNFTDYCDGKVTQNCIQKGKLSSNPKIRKMAIFAENARKWKHECGGIIEKHLTGGAMSKAALAKTLILGGVQASIAGFKDATENPINKLKEIEQGLIDQTRLNANENPNGATPELLQKQNNVINYLNELKKKEKVEHILEGIDKGVGEIMSNIPDDESSENSNDNTTDVNNIELKKPEFKPNYKLYLEGLFNINVPDILKNNKNLLAGNMFKQFNFSLQ